MTPSPLSDDSRTLMAELYSLHAKAVIDRLLKCYRTADQDAVADALIEALIRVMACDVRTIPDLENRIAREARCRLRSKFRSNTRQKDREKKYTSDLVTDKGLGGPSPDDEASDRELAAHYRKVVAKTCEETLVLDLWLNGLTDVEELAVKVGQEPDQVKKIQARLRQRIARLRAQEGQP